MLSGRTRHSCGDTSSSCSSTDSSLQVDPGPLVRFSFIGPGHFGPHYLRAALSEHPHFCDGLLLDAKEKGVLFPVVHFVEIYAFSERLLPEHALGEDFILQQGLYREIRSIVPEMDGLLPLSSWQSGYMLLGFKSMDRSFNQVMVDTWKDWTGARYIYINLPDELGLKRISLFHREAPYGALDLFTYLVLVECTNISSKLHQAQLLDFAQRLRVQRITGYISVYSVEPKELYRSCLGKSDTFEHLLNGLEATQPRVNCK